MDGSNDDGEQFECDQTIPGAPAVAAAARSVACAAHAEVARVQQVDTSFRGAALDPFNIKSGSNKLTVNEGGQACSVAIFSRRNFPEDCRLF